MANGVLEKSIREKIESTYHPKHFELQNESAKHRAHAHHKNLTANGKDTTETHFRVVVVSEVFTNLSRVERSRHLHALLKDELEGGVHALSQRLLSPSEWSS